MNIKEQAKLDYADYARTDAENALVKEFFDCSDLDDFFTFEDLFGPDYAKVGRKLNALFDQFLAEEAGE